MPPASAERLLRWSLAFVWLATGLLVAHPYYRLEGMRWLAPLGLGSWVMFATCAAEIALAAVVVARPTTTFFAVAQTGPIVAFTLILSALDPMLLVHPFGVLTKNVPLVAAIWGAWLLHREGDTDRAAWALRVGVASVWITEGLFPKLVFQQAMEIDVVTAWGFSASTASILIRVMGVLQVTAGVLSLLLRGRLLGWLYGAFVLALLLLPLVVTIAMPLTWAHPFGPLTKNVVILAAAYVLYRRCTRISS